MKEELRENASHGTIGWPIALYEWQGDQNWHVTPHWHEEIEFICFKEGIFRVWLNAREYIIESPALLCVHPQELHSIMLTAGGTGYAQVHGRYCTTSYDKLKLDLTYIRNYSIWLDLKLILMTPKVLLMKESTDGFEEGLWEDPALKE